MATVKSLIEQLEKIEDKEQSVIFQYYLAEHFEFEDKGTPTAEQFDEATDDLDDESLWEESAETVNDYLFGIMYKDELKDEDEDKDEDEYEDEDED
jgi:hypothetical protein